MNKHPWKNMEHPKIGKFELLIEAEVDHENGKKFFALIKTKARPKYSEKYSGYGYRILEKFHVPIIWGRKVLDHHYVLWGNTPNYTEMGITHLTTPAGNPVRGGKPMKSFFELIKSSEFMTFINKTKQ